jgi:alkylation response protein AidB-like acyl-CoA dehydrogenase
MDVPPAIADDRHLSCPTSRGDEALLATLSAECLSIRRERIASDGFPTATIDRLRGEGLLVAPLPTEAGGFGWGTEAGGTLSLCSALRFLGYGSLPVGRVYEAHVNAIALIFRYGGAEVREFAARATRGGHLFALWVTAGDDDVRVEARGLRLRLTGAKNFCSAAGYATRAVITARSENGGEQLFAIDTRDITVTGARKLLHGMNATMTGAIRIDCDVPGNHRIGSPGDYLREPEFSAGAWRTSAVTVGGLWALVDEAIGQLRARGRHRHPGQAARIGQMLIEANAAAIWIRAAAERAASRLHSTRSVIGHIGLARLAIEQACLNVIPLVQRSLGLAGFLSDNPIEILTRDLATYLRQPAGDEVLTEAAIAFAESAQPSSLGDIP